MQVTQASVYIESILSLSLLFITFDELIIKCACPVFIWAAVGEIGGKPYFIDFYSTHTYHTWFCMGEQMLKMRETRNYSNKSIIKSTARQADFFQ